VARLARPVTLHDMAEATRERGYAYLGLTDHSQTAHYAGGLKPAAVAAQQRQIELLNVRSPAGFHVFKAPDLLRRVSVQPHQLDVRAAGDDVQRLPSISPCSPNDHSAPFHRFSLPPDGRATPALAAEPVERGT